MDQKPYRAGAPLKRPVQASPAIRTQPQTQPPAQSSAPKQRVLQRKRLSKKQLLLIGIPVLVILVALGWYLYNRSTSTLIDSSKYQAVFLTNGQVYFGKFREKNATYSTLTDVYYFESNNSTTPAAATTTTSNTAPKLIKLGKEIHAPEDQMAIKNDQILFFENLTPNGQVAKAIADYQQKQ